MNNINYITQKYFKTICSILYFIKLHAKISHFVCMFTIVLLLNANLEISLKIFLELIVDFIVHKQCAFILSQTVILSWMERQKKK